MTPPFSISRRIALTTLTGAAAALISWAGPDYDKVLALANTGYGTDAAQTVRDWRQAMRDALALDEMGKIERINEFFNRRILFGEDAVIWGRNDYWATPLEFMGRGIGDCEDFSIAKYYSLRSLGIPNDKLRITYVKARIGGPRSDVTQAHMVLGYYADPAGEPYILDNLITEVRPASRRNDLIPIFSFNSEGLWTGSGAGEKKSTDNATARLSRWRDLIIRMQAEGFE